MTEGNPYAEAVREIDGITYTVRKLPATTGLMVGAEIAKLVGDEDVIALFLAANKEERASLADNPKVVGKVIARLAENLNESTLGAIKKLTHGMTADKVFRPGVEKPIPGNVFDNFDTHFAGRYRHLWSVASFAFEVNFRGPTVGLP